MYIIYINDARSSKYNEIYLLIKYTKSVLWRVAKHLSYIEDALCLNVKHSRGKCICLTTLSIQDFLTLGRDVTSFGDDTVSYLRTSESSVTPLWKLQEELEEVFSPVALYPPQIPRVLHFDIYIYLCSGNIYRSADKSLARPGRKQATATKL